MSERSVLPRPKTRLGAILLASLLVAVLGELGRALIEKLLDRRAISLQSAEDVLIALAIPALIAGFVLWCGGAVWVYRWLRARRQMARSDHTDLS